jgi:hypothetical protein
MIPSEDSPDAGNNAPAASKVNVPFSDNRGNPNGLYWNADEQKDWMERAAKRGGSTVFFDDPHLRIDHVLQAGWRFHAALSLIGIAPKRRTDNPMDWDLGIPGRQYGKGDYMWYMQYSALRAFQAR